MKRRDINWLFLFSVFLRVALLVVEEVFEARGGTFTAPTLVQLTILVMVVALYHKHASPDGVVE